MTATAFAHWAATYELFEGDIAWDTWRQGILHELLRLNRTQLRVLDVGAGTGIGYRAIKHELPDAVTTSLDRSVEMLDAGEVPMDQRLVADMAGFSLVEHYDAVVSGFDALNYLNYEGLAGFFRSAAAVLREGGHVIFDYSSPKLLREDWRCLETSTERDAFTLRRRHRFDDLLKRSESELILARAGAVLWTEIHYQYAYDTYEVYRLANRYGFEVEETRNIDGTPFSPASTTHVYVMSRCAGGPA